MKSLFLLSIILLISACSGVDTTIRSNSNQSISLSQYSTFGFFQPLDTDVTYETLISQYLKKATINEMSNRGFVLNNENPDLLINFHSNVENKQYVHQMPASNRGGYYSYRGRAYYDAWLGYDTYVENYTEGTVNIDIVDRKQNKMVWEGIAVGRLSEKKQQDMESTLQQIVTDIFTVFPISGSNSTTP